MEEEFTISFFERNKKFNSSIEKVRDIYKKKHDIAHITSLNSGTKIFNSEEIIDYLSPLEKYLNISAIKRQKSIMNLLVPGTVIYGKIMNSNETTIRFSLLKIRNYPSRWIDDLNLMFYVPVSNFLSTKNFSSIAHGDVYSATIEEISDVLLCSLNELLSERSLDYPIDENIKRSTFLDDLIKREQFYNLKIPYDICRKLKINIKHYNLLINNPPKTVFNEDEYFDILRMQQYAKWSDNLTEKAVKCIREGRSNDAFKFLEQALTLNVSNVEAHVAKGAYLANGGKLQEAISCFKYALSINKGHKNGNEYLKSTCLKLAQNFEKAGSIVEALELYNDLQKIIGGSDPQIQQNIIKLQDSLYLPNKKSEEQLIHEENSISTNIIQGQIDLALFETNAPDEKQKIISNVNKFTSPIDINKVITDQYPFTQNHNITSECKKLKSTGRLQHLADDELQFVASLLKK